MADIANTLVEKDPSLLNPENREKLLAKIDAFFSASMRSRSS
jgi:hypothetical protein